MMITTQMNAITRHDSNILTVSNRGKERSAPIYESKGTAGLDDHVSEEDPHHEGKSKSDHAEGSIESAQDISLEEEIE